MLKKCRKSLLVNVKTLIFAFESICQMNQDNTLKQLSDVKTCRECLFIYIDCCIISR